MTNDEKIVVTSILYQYTNAKLFYDIFGNWTKFNSYLEKGPEVMKDYFEKEWNNFRIQLKNNENIKFKINGLDREVTRNDFDITMNRTKNNTFVFFFKFPDYDYSEAASKYVALALGREIPRYFTLEYSVNNLTNESSYVIGEFFIGEGSKKTHKNHGFVDNDRMTFFASKILELLESEGL